MKFFIVLFVAAVVIAGAWWYARRRAATAPSDPVAPEPVSRPDVTTNAAGGRVR
jgi:flagellar basal body-associated protein FliL